jgi:hypothetical protein
VTALERIDQLENGVTKIGSNVVYSPLADWQYIFRAFKVMRAIAIENNAEILAPNGISGERSEHGIDLEFEERMTKES